MVGSPLRLVRVSHLSFLARCAVLGRYALPHGGWGLKFSYKVVGYPAAFMPLLRTWPYLGMQVIIAVHRAHSCIRLPMLCSFVFVFLLLYVLLFFTSSLHSTFLYNESLLASRRLPDKNWFDFSMPCDQYVWYLPQYGITIKFWWATKNNSLCWFEALYDFRPTTWRKPVHRWKHVC